ncbi:acyl carrier protein [Nonomuraea longicatena]|uniref:Carrier domain-containing protein n=1 Tax=Nonomuraea longicatena TaxID=83682 RepID=A0ABN1Q3P0_9ACTN
MTRSVHPTIAAIIRRVGELPPDLDITAEQHLRDDLGIDSLKLIDVVVHVEEELGVAIEDEQVPRMATAGDLDRHVAEPA